MSNRVTIILEILEILKGPARFRCFKKKIFGKPVSDFLHDKIQKSASRFKMSIFQTFWKVYCCAKFLFFCVRDFKFWLLAYFLIFFNCAKFQKDWTTFVIDIL